MPQLNSHNAVKIALVLSLGAGPASAQTITFSGDNARSDNACSPWLGQSTCVGNPSIIPEGNQPGPLDFSLPTYSSLIIGTSALGGTGVGSVTVKDGADITGYGLLVGQEAGSSGSIVITGSNSKWTSKQTSTVGAFGSGELKILDGGQYTSAQDFWLGHALGSRGSLTISGVSANGVRSSVNVPYLFSGYNGEGSILIEDGGLLDATSDVFLSATKRFSGYPHGVGKTSVVVIGVNKATGLSSTFRVNGELDLDNGSQLSILSGASVATTANLRLGLFGASDATSVINVYGVDADTGLRSTLEVGGQLYAGSGWSPTTYNARGDLNIGGGALVTVKGRLFIGSAWGAVGKIHVDGIDQVTGLASTLQAEEPYFWAGYHDGTGTLIVSNGGQVNHLHDQGGFYSESSPNARATITVKDEGSRIFTASPVLFGSSGFGELNLVDGGTFSTPKTITLAHDEYNIYSKPTYEINIGRGGRAGRLDAPLVVGGNGTAIVNFDHTDDIKFTPKLSGTLSVNQLQTGRTTLMSSNDYSGATLVSAGTLAAGGLNTLSPNSAHTLSTGARLELNGQSQTIASMDSAGVIDFGGYSGTVLNVTGNYDSNGGTLQTHAVLGDDSSTTDRMIIAGDKTGTTLLRVVNKGGLGALTNEGIEMITVQGQSTGTLKLVGDYTAANGQDVVVGGAYAYQLHQGNASGSETKNWYLRSEMAPVEPPSPGAGPIPPPNSGPPALDAEPASPAYQAGVPVYEAYPQFLMGLNYMTTWQQRVGNRLWSKAGGMSIQQHASAGAPVELLSDPPLIEGSGVWGRSEGRYFDLEPKDSTTDSKIKYDAVKIQLGYDRLLSESGNGKLVGGVSAHHVTGASRVTSIHGNGKINTKGYGVGATLTWYGNNKVYVDTQASHTWYRSDLKSNTAQRTLTDKNKGYGYAFSIEVGKNYMLNNQWSVTPQAQLSYSHIGFKAFDDPFSARVSANKSHGLEGRLGMSVNYQNSWGGVNGKIRRNSAYAILNYTTDLMSKSEVDVSTTPISQKPDRHWLGLSVGGTYNWDDDKYSVYAEVGARTALNNFWKSNGYRGILGVRARW